MYDKHFANPRFLPAYRKSPSRLFLEAAADATRDKQPNARDLGIGYSILTIPSQTYIARRVNVPYQAFQKHAYSPNPSNPKHFFWGQKKVPTAEQEIFGKWIVIQEAYSPPDNYTTWLMKQGYWMAFGILNKSQVPNPIMESEDCAAQAYSKVGCSPIIPDCLEPYYLTVVKYEAFARIKATKRDSSPNEKEVEIILETPTESDSIEDQLDNPIRQQLVQVVFQDLCLRDKRIIALRSIEELSYIKIAEELELYNKDGVLNTNLVGRKINAFKKKLKAIYEKFLASEQGLMNSQ